MRRRDLEAKDCVLPIQRIEDLNTAPLLLMAHRWQYRTGTVLECTVR